MVTLLFLGTELISSSVRAEGKWLAVTWPCISAPVGEAVAESQRANFVSLPACAFWGVRETLSLCICEGTLPPTALGHQQAVTRIAEKCFVFPRGCYLNKVYLVTSCKEKFSIFLYYFFLLGQKERRAQNKTVLFFFLKI